ncbi:MAG: haloacid dehalogenase [Anaerolineales bacterium]|jgi:translin|nr:haloacid dehalogenase [Anaerolineales bacterium]
MERLDEIGERIRQHLEEKNAARDRALQQSRTLIRHCSLAIRAAHRDERPEAQAELATASQLQAEMRRNLDGFPDLYHAGYTQDALKEYVEASIVTAILAGEPLPAPEDVGIDNAAYLCGLGEAAGELRRRVLDILRHGQTAEAERLMTVMDDIYGLLVTMDFPDALTGNLRRITDMVRGVVERTRGDLTTTSQQDDLKRALRSLEEKLPRP